VSTGSGELYGLKTGDRVVFLGTSSYAEYTTVPAAKVQVIPSGVEPGVAAAAFLQGLTALTLIRESHTVQKGEWTLVHAAAGGVGLWLVQILHATGAKVIGTASTPEKIALAKENGADYLIDYTKEDLVSRVKEITSGEGVAVVFDGVGKSTFDADLEITARKGTVVSFGNASGAVPPFSIARLSAKNLKILRPTLFNYIYTREEFDHYSSELFNFILKDKLNVRIHETYPLEEVQRAHIDLEGRKTTGKLLLKP
jgi:NADPH2:quinone reductase